MGLDWTSTAPSNSSFISDHSLFGHHHHHHQEQAEMAGVAAVAAATLGGVRSGYATRSSTGTLVRSMCIPGQSTMGSNLFGPSPVAQNQVGSGAGAGSGGAQRKKRRRYGPKPEPPYTCYCGKVFKRHEHMLRHRATHDDMIKYECPICGKCFRRQDVMHRHTMTHSSRGRLQNKMRAAASAPSSSSKSSLTVAPAAAAANASFRQQAGEDENMLNVNRKREHERSNMGYTSKSHEALEDPTLRVGLAEYPVTTTSSRHNQDHHIAAAQLYSACTGTRYSYATYPANAEHIYGGGGGVSVAEAEYARSESFDALAGYHNRMAPSLSHPPAFFPSAPGFAPNAIGADQFNMAMGRPHLPMHMSTTLGSVDYEYETKPVGADAGQHYAQSWHGGYALGHGSVHMGASESEWSEQSPSGPSTHTFASPAWSQKAELMRREGGGSNSAGTPLSMLSNRQLSLEPASRWHAHPEYQQQLQLQQQYQQQQHQQNQHGSPIVGDVNSEAGFGNMDRSPAYGTRRRLSGMYGPNGGSSNLAQVAPAHGHGLVVKEEAHSDAVAGNSMGLGLFEQTHGGHESASLPFMTTPMFVSASAVNGDTHGHSGGGERGGLPHHAAHASPHISNGGILSSSSPSHYLGAGMTSMHVSHNFSYAPAGDSGKQGFTSMSSVMEPFDTGSPLTEATGAASPRSHSHGQAYPQAVGGGAGSKQVDTSREASVDPTIDPHLAGADKGYVSSTSTASLHGGKGHAGRRW
ncbi:hypothetical protein EX895_005204 [Sporisorium graminicola]|uniref:C2H2-type domain-containing protein n=1 Tax=Sporisorium graminicola TaxID=280036 RepID=A0A4U7KN51_9BASI|nr:hypothetical protein EX895_005204 [Sporisorium graminicola]TKY85664.1 hypothetical protein EX895_005204 [Sporisorium graminicola]